MAGQPIEGQKADPFVHGIHEVRRVLLEEIMLKSADLAEGIGMIKNQQILGKLSGGCEIDGFEALLDGIQERRLEPGPDQDPTERVHIASVRYPSHKGSFEEGSAATHERVVNGIPRGGETLDEESGKLGFETGAVRDFMEGVSLALHGRPKFVHIS